MAWWEQPGIWHLFISLATLALVIFTIVWGTGLWTRRERVKIKFTNIDYRIIAPKQEIRVRVYVGGEFQRSGEKEIRYINQVIFQPDKKLYNKLSKYFNLPASGLIKINTRLKLQREVIVALSPSYPDYAMRSGVQEQPLAIQKIAEELAQKTYKVGLVWEDKPDKIKWKTITPEDFEEWREV